MKHVLLAILIGLFCGCGTEKTDTEPGSQAEANAAPADPDAKVESEVLKSEMRNLAVELLQAKSPEAPAAEIEKKADAMLDTGLKKMREEYPDFLMVSAGYEAELKAGTADPDIDAHVNAAQKKFEEFGVELPELTKKLIADYKSGTLSPVRKELLSQMLTFSEKKLENDIQ